MKEAVVVKGVWGVSPGLFAVLLGGDASFRL
jgi:hypothetical protein